MNYLRYLMTLCQLPKSCLKNEVNFSALFNDFERSIPLKNSCETWNFHGGERRL